MPSRQQSIGTLLDLVFGIARVPGGGPRWITLPPWPWLCHYCDTGGGGDFAAAKLDRTRLGRRRIICQPYEWRHDFQNAGLTQDDQERIQTAVRHHVNGRGTAATWDIQRQTFQIVSALQIDWRKA